MCQLCTFYYPLRKKRCILLPEGTDVHIQQCIREEDLKLCLPSYPKVIVELEKNKKLNCIYGAYNLIMVLYLIMLISSTLKILFCFGFLSFENFWFYIWV